MNSYVAPDIPDATNPREEEEDDGGIRESCMRSTADDGGGGTGRYPVQLEEAAFDRKSAYNIGGGGWAWLCRLSRSSASWIEGRNVPVGQFCVRGEAVGDSVGEHQADAGQGSWGLGGSTSGRGLKGGMWREEIERESCTDNDLRRFVALWDEALSGLEMRDGAGAGKGGTRRMTCSLNVCASTRWTWLKCYVSHNNCQY